jgi:hypothetical protein
MADSSNTSEPAAVRSAHTNAEGLGGASVTFPDGTVDSRTIAKAAYASGSITHSTFVTRLNRLATWEQTQIDAARDAQRGTYLANS